VSLAGTILIYAAFNLVAVLTSYPTGFLSDRIRRRNLVVLSLGVFALTYLEFGITRHIAAIACCFVLYGMYQGVSRSVGKADHGTLRLGRKRFLYGAVFAALGVIALFGLVPADRPGHRA
jgi:MFS family permease